MNVCVLRPLRSERLKKFEVWSYIGALSIIEQIGLSYQVCENINLKELRNCDLVICPQNLSLKSSEVKDLISFVERGGILVVSGIFGVPDSSEITGVKEEFDRVLGVRVIQESDYVKSKELYLSGIVTPNFKSKAVIERYVFSDVYPKLPLFGYFKIRESRNSLSIGRVVMCGTKESPSSFVEGPLMMFIERGRGLVVRINPPIFGVVGLLLHRFTSNCLPGFTEVCLLPHVSGDVVWSELAAKGYAKIPVVDEYRLLLENLITHLALKIKGTLVKKHHIPPTKEVERPAFICALTHDVDALYYDSEKWMCFERWIEIESKYNAKSAFYFIASLSNVSYPMPCRNYSVESEEVKGIVKRLKDKGWEVGLHSTAYWDLELMRREKELLESVLGEKVVGTRQHFLMISQNTLKNCAELNYIYDTSLYKESGEFTFLTGTTLPYTLYDATSGEPLGIVELSSVLEDGVIFGFYKNGKCDYEDAYIKAIEYLSHVLKHEGVLVLNWHQRTCKYMKHVEDWTPIYDWTLSYVVGKGGAFILPKDLAKWWILRNRLRVRTVINEHMKIALDNPQPEDLIFTLIVRVPLNTKVEDVLLNGHKLTYYINKRDWYLEIHVKLHVKKRSHAVLLIS